MGSCRETKNLWWLLFGFRPNWGGDQSMVGRWRGYPVFSRRWWKWGREYIWHDSFGKFWSRWFICPATGHRNVKDVSDPGEPKDLHCFDCEQRTQK